MHETRPSQFHESNPGWAGVDRRSKPPPMKDDPNYIVSQLETYINDRLTENGTRHREYFDGRFDEVLILIRSGFPEGDPTGHRKAHEIQIANAEWWTKLKTEIVYKLAGGAGLAVLGFVCLALWEHFKQEVRK